MQVVAKTFDGTVVVNCTIAVCVALAMVIIFFIAKAVRTTIRTKRTIKIRKTFSIERILVTIPVNFAIGVTRTMSVIVTRDVWPRSGIPRFNFNDTALKREARKYD